MTRTTHHFPIWQIVEEMLPYWMDASYKRKLAGDIEQHLILCGQSYWMGADFELYTEPINECVPVLLLDRIPEREVRQA